MGGVIEFFVRRKSDKKILTTSKACENDMTSQKTHKIRQTVNNFD